MHRGFYAVKRPCSKDIEQKQNLTSIKDYKSVTNKQIMEDSNPNIYLIIYIYIYIYIYIHLQNVVKLYPFALKILRRNKILLPIKGHNFATKKITSKNSIDTDLVNINTFIKFGQILSICSKDTERKCNYYTNQGS